MAAGSDGKRWFEEGSLKGGWYGLPNFVRRMLVEAGEDADQWIDKNGTSGGLSAVPAYIRGRLAMAGENAIKWAPAGGGPPTGLVWHLDSTDPGTNESVDAYLTRHGGADIVNSVSMSLALAATSAGTPTIRWDATTSNWWDLYYPLPQTGSPRFVYELSRNDGGDLTAIEADCGTYNYTSPGARGCGVTFFDPATPLANHVILTVYDQSYSTGAYIRVIVDNTVIYSEFVPLAVYARFAKTLRLKALGAGAFEAYSDGVLLPVSITAGQTYTAAGLHFWHDAGAAFTDRAGFDNLRAYV